MQSDFREPRYEFCELSPSLMIDQKAPNPHTRGNMQRCMLTYTLNNLTVCANTYQTSISFIENQGPIALKN